MKLLEERRKKKTYEPAKTEVIELETCGVLCSSFEGYTLEDLQRVLEEMDRTDEFEFP